jgi:hypothetical protein
VTDKVVELHPKKVKVYEADAWQCRDCNSLLFKLFSDDSIVCAGCGGLSALRHFDPREKP